MQCSIFVLVSALIAAPSLTLSPCSDDRCFLSPDTNKIPFSDLSVAALAGRCHTECALEVLGRNHRGMVSVFGIWTSVNEEEHVLDYDGLKQCVLGCRLVPTHFPNNNSCTIDCEEKCNANCSNTLSCEREGSIHCTKDQCNTGCLLYAKKFKFNEGMSLTLPPPPLSFTEIPESNIAGSFHINNASSLSSSEDEISAFLFKVETETRTYYVLQSTLTNALDLSYFSCQEVNISLAVVNRNGSSQFTSPTPVCVHGEPPSAPRNFKLAEIVDDLRHGFSGSAVITLKWEPPDGAIALDGYELVVERIRGPSVSCSNNAFHVRINNTNDTSYVLMASSPMDLPRFGPNSTSVCVYEMRLRSLPGLASEKIEVNLGRDGPVTSPDPPTVDWNCSGKINNETGIYTLQFEFSYTNVSLIQEAIVYYEISVDNTNHPGQNIPILRETIDIEKVEEGNLTRRNDNRFICADGVASYSFELTNTGEIISGVFRMSNICPEDLYSIELNFRRNVTGIWWRPLPKTPENCLVNAPGVPPSKVPVETIMLVEEVPLSYTKYQGHRVLDEFHLTWDAPTDPFGEIIAYEVFVGHRLRQNSNANALELTNSSKTEIAIENYTIPFNPTACLFVQIRSIGEFMMSDWSDTFYIPIEDGYTERYCIPFDVPATNNDEEEVSPFRAGVIAESIIIFLLLLVILIISCILLWHIRHKRYKLLQESMISMGPIRRPYNGLSVPPMGDKVEVGPAGNGWEIPLEYIVREQQLGEGAFGTVAKGFIRGPIPGTYTMQNRIHASVAIKFLKDHSSEQEKRDFVGEITLLKRIGFAKHPHVVGLFGCVTIPEPMCILLEYLEYGNLRDYLQSISEEVNRLKQDSQGVVSVVRLPATSAYTNLGDVEPDNLLSFAFQIASGMEFLSSLDVIHRDLACRNVLVGDQKMLKISDFGLSREGDIYVKTTGGRLPFKWMALESLRDREFTVQSDVWSYGVILWEIATLGQFPYPNIANEEMLDHIQEGNRLEQPPNCSNEVYEQMLTCWNVQPEERPSFTDLKMRFEAMLLEVREYLLFTTLTAGEDAPVPNGMAQGDEVLGSTTYTNISTQSPIPEQGHTGSYMSGVANEESVPDQQDMDM